jgi:cell division protein FtsQ
MPVGVVDDSGEPVAVDGSGRLLPGVPLGGLPDLEAESPENARLEGAARAQAIVLGAAPRALLPAVEASAATDRGIEVRLTGGAELRFGDPVEAGAKWRAAAAVLADPDLTGLSYIDLRIPDRPAVGGDPRAAEPQPQL